MAQWAIRSPAYVCALESKVVTSLGVHGELDILTDTAQMVQEPPQLLWAMTPDHKYVIEITKLACGHAHMHTRTHTHTKVNDTGKM